MWKNKESFHVKPKTIGEEIAIVREMQRIIAELEEDAV